MSVNDKFWEYVWMFFSMPWWVQILAVVAAILIYRVVGSWLDGPTYEKYMAEAERRKRELNV